MINGLNFCCCCCSLLLSLAHAFVWASDWPSLSLSISPFHPRPEVGFSGIRNSFERLMHHFLLFPTIFAIPPLFLTHQLCGSPVSFAPPPPSRSHPLKDGHAGCRLLETGMGMGMGLRLGLWLLFLPPPFDADYSGPPRGMDGVCQCVGLECIFRYGNI